MSEQDVENRLCKFVDRGIAFIKLNFQCSDGEETLEVSLSDCKFLDEKKGPHILAQYIRALSTKCVEYSLDLNVYNTDTSDSVYFFNYNIKSVEYNLLQIVPMAKIQLFFLQNDIKKFYQHNFEFRVIN